MVDSFILLDGSEGPFFVLTLFALWQLWLFQRPWSGNARWKHQGKKYQEIHINPLALEDAALCVFDVLKEVQMQLTPGGPGHVSKSLPFLVECVASEFTSAGMDTVRALSSNCCLESI